MHLTHQLDVFKEIAEHSFDEVFVTDVNGTVLYVNGACKKNYGLDSDEIIGKNIKELEEKLFYPSATLEVLKTKKSVEMIQKTVWGKRLFVKSRPIFNEQHELIRVISYSRDLTELLSLRQRVNQLERRLVIVNDNFITQSKIMKKIVSDIELASTSDAPVLIIGETGVGKKTIAKQIHKLSYLNEHHLNIINCSTLTEHELNLQLNHKHREGGTLYLEEIADLSLSLQSYLLEYLVKHEDSIVDNGLRIIACTSKDLHALIEKQKFKEQLYYRLTILVINVPPLRNRQRDIYPLSMTFLNKFNYKYGKNIKLSPIVVNAFLEYDWPGNIRELRNLIENLVITTEDDSINIDQLPFKVRVGSISNAETLPEKLEKFEKSLVVEAYDLFGSSYKVAEYLGISQSSAIRKIQKYITKNL